MKICGRSNVCCLLAGIVMNIFALPLVPHGSAAELHPGDILVDYFNGNQIVQLAPDGTLLATFTGPGSQWLGAALTPDGRIVTTTRSPVRGVNVINPANSMVSSFATPGVFVPGKCSVFADGNIAVPDQASNVYLYSPTGQLVRTISPYGASYLSASGHAADDTLWVTDLTQGRVYHMSETGASLSWFSVGFRCADIAVDPTDNTLWLPAQSSGVIHHFSQLGISLGDIPTFNGKPSEGVAVAPDGSLYMTTAWSTLVGHVSRGGVLINSFDSHTAEPYCLTVVPTAVAEPSSIVLLGIAAGGFIGYRVRRRQRDATAPKSGQNCFSFPSAVPNESSCAPVDAGI